MGELRLERATGSVIEGHGSFGGGRPPLKEADWGKMNSGWIMGRKRKELFLRVVRYAEVSKTSGGGGPEKVFQEEKPHPEEKRVHWRVKKTPPPFKGVRKGGSQIRKDSSHKESPSWVPRHLAGRQGESRKRESQKMEGGKFIEVVREQGQRGFG